MRTIALALFVAAAAPAAAQVHDHAVVDHSAVPTAPSPGPADYLTLNVEVSDAGIDPAAVFIPAGRTIQLMLRNRGSMEHHYRIVGLEPDELMWLTRPDTPAQGLTADTEHDHHNRQIVRQRAISPGGIRPTGREVHGYAAGGSGVDVVFFRATQAGTFVVRCDLHPEKTGTVVVFDGDGAASALPPSAGRRAPALARVLTRDLGEVDYPGAPGVLVEATYATSEYIEQALGGAAGVSAIDRDRHIGFLLTERTHTATLPADTTAPALYVNGSRAAFVSRTIVTDSAHHRATMYRFTRDAGFDEGHQMMTLRMAQGPEATWHLPLVIPDAATAAAGVTGLGDQWGLILALLGGMLAAMWPCLFQLTVYFIPALAGVAMQDSGASSASRHRPVLVAALFFILGFTIVYTATGALIGYAAQRLGGTSEFEAWQRWFGMAAGVIVIGLAVRVAAKARAPLICRMPVLSGMAHSGKPATRVEMMLAGLAFATGCMTCFGSALVVGMVVYIGLAESALYGALILFLFSLGMGIPLVIAALAMARALPLLMKLENAVPWMGLVSAVLMAGFGVLLISGNYMLVSEWTYRAVDGVGSLPVTGSRTAAAGALVAAIGGLACLGWKLRRTPRVSTGSV
jgi:cytochrome c-type biogenesis protein